MAIRKTSFISGEYYHIYNRGNDKRVIFHDLGDYRRFLKLLYLANSDKSFTVRDVGQQPFDIDRGKPIVSIGAYCLMPNHFHLLIFQPNEGNVSKFMQKLTTGYSMYYNIKYGRTGSLFEGKFKSEHAKDDSHLKYLFSYIHLNPIKLIDRKWREAGIRNKKQALSFLVNYYYSSYRDYKMIDRPNKTILNKKDFPEYFPNVSSFDSEILDWINL